MKKLLIIAGLLLASFNLIAQEKCNEIATENILVHFNEGSSRLTDETKQALSALAVNIRKYSDCKWVVTGYCGKTKEDAQTSWNRVNIVVNRYLVNNEGIANDRFIFLFGQSGGDCNTVSLRIAKPDEKGPSFVEAPYPELRND